MDELESFKIFLRREKGQGERTIVTNLKLIRKILTSTPAITLEIFTSLIEKMMDDNKSVSYIKQHISVIRHWGEFTGNSELQDFKLKRRIRVDRVPFIKGTFADDEVETFLTLPNPYEGGVYRDRYNMWILFYYILFYHGMRTIEVAKLKVNDIDFGRNVILSYSKVKEIRMIPISPVVRDLLKTYIFSLRGDYLFPPFHARSKAKGIPHVLQNDWNYFFKNQIKRMGLKRDNLTPYSARHTYGTRQAEEDVSLKKIQVIMGHKRLETTGKYLHPSLKSLQEVQDNDRMTLLHQSGVAQLREVYKTFKSLEERYVDKLYAFFEPSEDGEEVRVVFKVRKLGL